MNEARNEYNTKQRQALLDFFKAHREGQFTVAQIADAVCAEHDIGKSTVYRLVAKMHSEGLLTRAGDDCSHAAKYGYVDGEHGCVEHFHLRCSMCGRVVHIEDKTTENAILSVLGNNNFTLDEGATVVVGKCKDCGKVTK